MTTLLYDQAIPFVAETFAKHVQCCPYSTGQLTREQLMTAELLLVRSVTPVSRVMLADTPVMAVGSVTAGLDHLDVEGLAEAGVPWYHAPGANARAVAEYVASVLAHLNSREHVSRQPLGLIGCGEVGSRVTRLAEAMGWSVCVYDPPKAARDASFISASWDELMSCAVLCCCVPLTQHGQWPTHHLIDAGVLRQLPEQAIVINVGRGGVLDEAACLAQTRVRWCCDVWDNEPAVNPEMVQRALLATPHIAGYTRQAKANLTWQVYEAMAESFGWQGLASRPYHTAAVTLTDNASILAHDDPSHTSERMRQAYQHTDAKLFRQLRSDYVFRSEWFM